MMDNENVTIMSEAGDDGGIDVSIQSADRDNKLVHSTDEPDQQDEPA